MMQSLFMATDLWSEYARALQILVSDLGRGEIRLGLARVNDRKLRVT